MSKTVKKAASKTAPKKVSKLASFKEALFGGDKKKSEAKGKAAVKPAKAPAAAKAKAKAAPVKAAKPTAGKAAKTPKAPLLTKAAAPKAESKKENAKQVKKAEKPVKVAPEKVAKTDKLEKKVQVKAASGKPVSKKSMAASLNASMNALKGGGKAQSAEPEAVCREVACEGLATTAHYCRLHYIKNWKKIKRKEVILKEGKLIQYIEELVVKYPDKYIEAIRQDLANDKDFAKVIYDLDLDESVDDFEVDGENLEAVIDTIKRDFDDEGDTF